MPRATAPTARRAARKRAPAARRAAPSTTSSARRHVALLRGINVGGNNLIRMTDLRAAFEALGFTDVVTYIQSGNVVFTSPRAATTATLTRRLEAALADAFGYQAAVVVLSAAELARVVEQAPAGFGADGERYRHDVLFVLPPATPTAVLAEVSLAPGVDEAAAGDHAVYFRRLVARASQSHLPRLVQRPIYRSLTVRNWTTTTRLLALATT